MVTSYDVLTITAVCMVIVVYYFKSRVTRTPSPTPKDEHTTIAKSTTKTVLSISLGSPTRDYERVIKLNNTEIMIKRIGVNGNLNEMRRILTSYDGKVEAIGLGGLSLSLICNGSEWPFREFDFIKQCVTHTPVTDGLMVRRVIERMAFDVFKENEHKILPHKRTPTVLATASIDRFDLVEPFLQAKHNMIFGDLMFGLDIPIALRRWNMVKALAYIMAPIVTNLIPFAWLYPVGNAQEKHVPKWQSVYEESDVILSDSHYITTTCSNLKGKCLITNTITQRDVEILKKAQLKWLMTTTPMIDKRSLGTNALGAAIIAVSGLKRNLTVDEMREFVKNNPVLKPKLRLL